MKPDCCGGESDLAILGGGSAAFAAALKASELGARVLMINEGTIGGTCVNIGCVPSKTLIRAAENAHGNRSSRFRGIEAGEGRVDFPELVREKDELVASLRQSKYIDVASNDPKIEILEGRARLRDAHTLEVGGALHRAGKILIATGARPARPPIPGLDDPGIWDSTAALDASALPRDLIVLGGRYIALELGQMFARLGSRVTIIQRSDQLLPGEDADLAEALRVYLEREGIEIRTGHQVERVTREGARWSVEASHGGRSEKLWGDAVLSALGRAGNTEDLDGVELDARGFVRVGDDLQTSLPGVYAAGDVIGDELYVYAAAYEG
ncbi:MAG: FAD-dependent oxidoreductase, partial [Myxococcales bacterium]|nr:FAD-dependent oxidoreductase [Myxococcales bacterium]